MSPPSRVPTERRSKIVIGIFALFAGFLVYSIVGSIMEMQLASTLRDGLPVHINRIARIEDRHKTTALWLAVSLPIIMITCAVYMAGNAHALRKLPNRDGLNYSPGRIYGYLFIPLYNIIYPVKAFREHWKASEADPDPEFSWQHTETPKFITLWWLAGVVFWFSQRRLRGVIDFQSVEDISSTAKANLIHSGLGLVFCALSLYCMTKLTRRVTDFWTHTHGAPSLAAARVVAKKGESHE